MRSLSFFFLFVIVLACEQTKPRSYDYIQYRTFDLSAYDLPARIMLPNASAGIGTSMKPNVVYELGGFKWKLNVGRNFSLLIEDYGDYAYRFAEFKRKLLKPNKFFEIEIVKQTKDILIYRRKVKGEFVAQKNARFYIYSVRRIRENYYEIMNREQGDTKRVVDFMYHSIQSLKAKNEH
ncbi:MAG: hypothetical protein NWS92_00560 [Crocinitomicaceae bacterium]|jgi:hypothetical protein|nr:hypothetical protein [Crocinitomicaceae bacterium]MDP4723666.1 hypothetical protein [Crocinitomicaceae bacterium]MDP4738547.1 hypothetical protein [Crocinitomicaceae bacterium]MDP4798663.1 hypothetical protein [Crocinitomicaceae bacterium]MDP4806375.1 hypothetical protein [Crocinitomicaceae bacterium]